MTVSYNYTRRGLSVPEDQQYLLYALNIHLAMSRKIDNQAIHLHMAVMSHIAHNDEI